MTQSQLTRAAHLLALHEGSCCVPANSIFAQAFAEMEKDGKVVVKHSSISGYVDVYSMEFKARFNGDKE